MIPPLRGLRKRRCTRSSRRFGICAGPMRTSSPVAPARPRFRRKWGATRFRYPDAKQFKVDQANSRMFLPKLGWVRYRNSRVIEGELRNITVSRSCGISGLRRSRHKREVPAPGPRCGVADIDMGVARFATLSDGSFHVPLAFVPAP